MKRKSLAALAALALALAGCQGLIGANGQVTGFTVPAGCKGQAMFSYPMPQGSIMVQCDETGATAPARPAMLMRAAGAPPAGAHVTIDRQ